VVLVTGGAGFIGSHTVDRLVAKGRRVRVLDSIEPQVHLDRHRFRNPEAEYQESSVTDADAVERSLEGVSSVVHLAAQVGVGQSMYDMVRYVRDNTLGTAVLLDSLVRRRDQISELIAASSMSIYGEGAYVCEACGANPATVRRSIEDLKARRWDPVCTACNRVARPIPTPETKLLESDSVYAVTKKAQEELCLVFGRAYGVRVVALRFFNVYGPRQSLSNPYTGVAAIFSSRLLNGQRPLLFEDGYQSRDFVHVSDVVRGIELSLETKTADNVALNIGTGRPTEVRQVAEIIAEELTVDLKPEILERFRHGDIRHCFADISEAQWLLGFRPQVDFREGMKELVAWIRDESPTAIDKTEASTRELQKRGLVL
jgi:dTDP-L-rhamnose 4-epimerase